MPCLGREGQLDPPAGPPAPLLPDALRGASGTEPPCPPLCAALRSSGWSQAGCGDPCPCMSRPRPGSPRLPHPCGVLLRALPVRESRRVEPAGSRGHSRTHQGTVLGQACFCEEATKLDLAPPSLVPPTAPARLASLCCLGLPLPGARPGAWGQALGQVRGARCAGPGARPGARGGGAGSGPPSITVRGLQAPSLEKPLLRSSHRPYGRLWYKPALKNNNGNNNNNVSSSDCVELSHSRQPPAPAPGLPPAATPGLRWGGGPAAFYLCLGVRCAPAPGNAPTGDGAAERPCSPTGRRLVAAGPGGEGGRPVRREGGCALRPDQPGVTASTPGSGCILSSRTPIINGSMMTIKRREKRILFLLGQTIVGF